jgi:alkylation response protein AidB-like acyl-CoA dehydrogenase
VGHLGEELLGPTLIEFGTPEQQRRFLPRIRAAGELWCQGYSEPGAGSDLAAVATRATLDGGEWVISGQKVWTSLAHVADWCFALVRTGSAGHAGLSYLLVPMRQPGVTVRPIRQLTGTSEFNEVFFDGARTPADLVVGGAGNGWRVAMATLGFERGAATLGHQVGFQRELDRVLDASRSGGAAQDPILRDKLTRAVVGLDVLRAHTLRTLASTGAMSGQDASVVKLLWARWHRDLGELAMEVLGASGMVAPPSSPGAATAQGQDPPGLPDVVGERPYELDDFQRLFLFSRADTIYGGSDEIQRTIVAERILGLPRRARR